MVIVKICPTCGLENAPTIPFCSKCRVSLVSTAPTETSSLSTLDAEPNSNTVSKTLCPDCNAENESGAERCVYCDCTLCLDNCDDRQCRVELIWPWGKEFFAGTMRIGRDAPSPENLIKAIIAHGYDNISRSHAELKLDSTTGHVSVTDLGSTNGTFVDGVRIPALTPVVLKGGTVVRFAANLSVVISITKRQD